MKDNLKNKKVFVGLSGGVDSSVSIAILKKAGCDVTGVFIKVWSPDFLPCTWKEERRDAMRVCASLNIPFLTFDFEKEYKQEVVDYMINEYKIGRTPNPDVMCNKNVKFGAFLNKALKMGADFVATGHYARVREIKNSPIELLEGVDKNKDQSYFLWTLNQDQLKRVIFPVGEMTKSEVRKLAKKYALPTAEKKDSQGLCFMGKVDIKSFLKHYLKTERGNVLNNFGEVIGFHDGAIFYTIGERHGFTITLKGTEDKPLYVVLKDVDKNTITVSDEYNQKDKIFSVNKVELENVNWISGFAPDTNKKYLARSRYRQNCQKCIIKIKEKKVSAIFDNFQKGISAGQSLVFYDDEKCIGGGIIKNYSNSFD